MKYIKQLSVIMIITFIAELIKVFSPFPIPAGIYGLIILFALLCFNIIKLDQLENAADFLIAIMGIMFIPAGVGIINSTDSILPMLPAVIISTTAVTILVMAVSGKVTDIIIQRRKK